MQNDNTASSPKSSYAPKVKSADEEQALNYAVSLLTRREYARAELWSKLILKFEKEAALGALKRVTAQNLQSEERYCEMYQRHLLQGGYGPRKFSAQMAKMQVKEEIYGKYLEADWLTGACDLLKKRYKGEALSDFKTAQKALAMLARRGFDYSQCREALDKIKALSFEE